MRILFFSHYYTPEVNAPASRTSEHCSVWASKGHEVTVVTCAPNHPSGKLYPGYRNRLHQVETINGVQVIRLWTLLAANQGFLWRTLNYLSYFGAVILALPFLPPADVVISTSPQFFCGLAGFFAGAFRRTPWVLEIRDLWPESIVTVGAMRKGLVVSAIERLEAFAYRRADQIVSVTHSFVPHIAERRGDPATIAVVRNGADLSKFERRQGEPDVKRELGLEAKFVAAYVGTHGLAHGLDVILDAAEILRDDPRIAFLMVGDGAECARLRDSRDRRGLENVHILGQRPKRDMPGVWMATDASLILLRRNEMFKKVLPSKMMEAMAMQCPIVLGVEGEAKNLLEEAKAGVAITPENASELAAAVCELADNPERAGRFGRQGRDFAAAHFDRAKLASDYLDLLRSVIARYRLTKAHGPVAVPGPPTG